MADTDELLQPGELPEAEVETVPDDIVVEPPRIMPQPEEITTLQYLYYTCIQYLMNPWFLLIIAFVLYKIWQNIKPSITGRYNDWQDQRKEAEYAAKYHKNPDEFRSKMEAMDAARARMQARYNTDAEQWAIKQKEAEERRRQQEVEDWENHKDGKGYKNRVKDGEDREREALKAQAVLKGKKGFKSDYNPLIGGAGGGGYRRPAPGGGSRGGGG